ncbi:hypothetical protein [Actinomycetospora soli]|uniref:hypothetical protein n=1 Tax=Actinomycetospora soli TaxID=2893887 RepID=UPI001E4CDC89|nr:hypothetical protein [Actinomycetospora soli]MCD2187753.1 hypothetical protein [Actinomycetospora soli]
MSSIPAGQLVLVLALGIFLVIVFWRVAIPIILALVLAKVVVSIAAMAQTLPLQPAASALATVAPLLH